MKELIISYTTYNRISSILRCKRWESPEYYSCRSLMPDIAKAMSILFVLPITIRIVRNCSSQQMGFTIMYMMVIWNCRGRKKDNTHKRENRQDKGDLPVEQKLKHRKQVGVIKIITYFFLQDNFIKYLRKSIMNVMN